MPPPPPPAHLNHHLVDTDRHQPLSGTNHKPPIFLINTILLHCLIICTVKSPLDSHEKYWERLDYSVISRTGKRCEREREIFSSQEKEKNYFNPQLLPLAAGAEYMNTDKISQLWVHIPRTSAALSPPSPLSLPPIFRLSSSLFLSPEWQSQHYRTTKMFN